MRRCLPICLSFLIALLAATGGATPARGFTIASYAGSSYDSNAATMDATLGVTGYRIEGFESTTLIPGLTVGFTNPDIAPSATLARLFDPSQPGELEGGFANNTWDGTYALTNGEGAAQAGNNWNFPFAQTVSFSIAGGTTSFGIGLANMADSTDHDILVNGVYLATIDDLPGIVYGAAARNLYIRIDAGSGERIDSVAVYEAVVNVDGLVFDHVALAASAVPEPGAATLLALAIAALARGVAGVRPPSGR